jgi:hypothetical protein
MLYQMKSLKPLVILILAVLIIAPFMQSCKKGDGDPFFSIYSRKARVAGDWKISKLTDNLAYGKITIETTYDGNKKKEVKTIHDSIIHVTNPTPHDSTFDYVTKQTWTGSVAYSFEKKGSYDILENFTNDTTMEKYTAEEKGLWYFTGGGKNSGFKYKELLGLQMQSYVYNPDGSASYSITGSGDNNQEIYEIYELKNNEIILKVITEETINTVKITRNLELTLIPR